MMKQLFNPKFLMLFSFTISLYSITLNAQTFEWAKSIQGLVDYQYGNVIAVDEQGNTYVTGTFKDTADFDPGPGEKKLMTEGRRSKDIFLAKYDHNGDYVWAIDIGWTGTSTDNGWGVTTDGAGNVYITGNFADTLDFDPGSGEAKLTAKRIAGFVAKYDSNGKYLWANTIGGTFEESIYDVAIDKAGYVYITGSYTRDIPELNLLQTGMNSAVLLVKYDSNGNYIWARGFGGNDGSADGYSLALDEASNVYITGRFQTNGGTADFDPGPGIDTLSSGQFPSIFLAKFDSSGNHRWAIGLTSDNADRGTGVAVDGAGNAYVTGYFMSSLVDFDPGPNTAIRINAGAGGSFGGDIFIAKYDANGNYVWAHGIGGPFEDLSHGVTVDRVGNVYITGQFNGVSNAAHPPIDFDPGSGTANLTSTAGSGFYNSPDVFVAKYDSSGNYMWAGSMGGQDDDRGKNIVADKAGNVYITGIFNSEPGDFDPGPGVGSLSQQGTASLSTFIVKMACSDTSSSYIPISVCNEDSYTFNDSVYTATGVYKQVVPNAAGCDSTITLDLTLSHIIEPVITTDSFTLGLNNTYTTYQWLKNGTPIPDATDATYAVTENADYQVVVTNGEGCTDTSDAYKVTNYGTSIDAIATLAKQIRIYPNPTEDILHIAAPLIVDVTITDIEGRTIMSIEDGSKNISLKGLSAGMYLLQVRSREGMVLNTIKVIKQ